MTTQPEQPIHQCKCDICWTGSDPVTVQYHQLFEFVAQPAE